MLWPSAKQWTFIIIASVLLGHFFVSLGREETIFDLLFESWYYLDLFFVSVISFCVVGYVAVVHISLDSRMPIHENLKRRLLFQSLLGVATPSLLAFLLTFVYMTFGLDQDIFETTFFIYEFPISIVVIFTINLVLFIITLLKPAKPVRSTLIVTQAGRTFPVLISNIAAIAKEGDYTLVYTFDQQKFVSSETLEQLEKDLAADTFFRANRQWIIHRTICGAYTTERSGKVNLTLKDPVSTGITVSQKKGQEFKSWLA